MRRWLAAGLLMTAAAWAAESDFGARLEQGNELLRQGDNAGALSIFRSLQGENPNSPELLFGLGCAEYGAALDASQGQKPEAVQKGLDAAREDFEKAAALGHGPLRTDASFNRANAIAQEAKRAASENPQALEKAYGRSIDAYEEVLRRYPDYTKARHNLEHMRYALKRFLQNPPPPQQQQSQGDDKNQQNQPNPSQQQNPSQGSQQDQKPQPQPQGQNPQPSQDDQKQEGEQESQESPEGEDSQPQESEGEPQQPSDPTQTSTQQKSIERQPRDGKENVEAILESLEERDRDEQMELRKGPRDTRILKEWW